MEDFLEDYMQTVKDLKLVDFVYYNEEDSVRTKINYRLITVLAQK